MPELPEVETTLRGIAPHILQHHITDVVIRHYGLRWPIARDIDKKLAGQQVVQLDRRGKYLLLHLTQGTLIIHLGMSGRLGVFDKNTSAQKHDHVDLEFNGKKILRFTDPRRFGAFIYTENHKEHQLLNHLGPEPLTEEFSGEYLFARAKNKKKAVKTFIMDQKIVVGVGNIYANEALFLARINPSQASGQIPLSSYENLTQHIKNILRLAIKQGGTTLKDFLNSDGKPGYFSQSLHVYGRENKPCTKCDTILVAIQIAKRQTVFCPRCQSLQ
ncbi:MAG: bifunctional DNA-formamidopyrimidine glycosylase/DNA-(apurinic or apyrimidinic site) lyase [Gammaproteobacteria bacterium]|jgi:formamidopyrimidine-DNA glycosylase